ncbi:unnamed protein product, partial [marine sediment metagenome]
KAMNELEKLKAEVKNLKSISDVSYLLFKLLHKIEALEEVLIERNLTSRRSRAAGACVCR